MVPYAAEKMHGSSPFAGGKRLLWADHSVTKERVHRSRLARSTIGTREHFPPLIRNNRQRGTVPARERFRRQIPPFNFGCQIRTHRLLIIKRKNLPKINRDRKNRSRNTSNFSRSLWKASVRSAQCPVARRTVLSPIGFVWNRMCSRLVALLLCIQDEDGCKRRY